ncbi:hypothetical protein AMS68_003058 [Peltaster fructicola]|uniref:Enoyl reductase (ER) domain-containing protein n=1 Tax=Peltaster fructicola TaxID=286661 RepID=A0A6H0XSA8_9PEZI|nr:hypothetical protein AMS68_003058 [Peltaster fructicola]
MVKTRQWLLENKPEGLPKLSGDDATFKLTETDLPELNEGQLLVKALFYSNDPAQRGWISSNVKPERLYVPPVEQGSPMRARALGEVIESKSDDYKKGDHVLATTGWTEYAIVDAKTSQPAPELPGGLARTHYLGALGSTGLTAYYGTKVIARASEDDVLVVSGAAGATGSMVVQIAKKLIGCKKVYGIAGSDEKCKWVEGLGADKCFNYKSSTFQQEMVDATKDFVNVYYDNVGGDILDFMLTRMARHGRIAACGAISQYNASADNMAGIKNWFEVISMRLEIRGFIVFDYLQHAKETLDIFRKALQEGKLKIDDASEHIVKTRFEEVPNTWMHLFEGGNTGKLITALQ